MNRILARKYRLLLEAERGTVYKDPGGRLSICLVYPNTYHVGMSNLGFTGMYTLLNSRNDVVCERAFLPDREDMDMFAGGAELCSLESGRPLREFDVIGFSVSFENDFPNVVKILELAGIKPFSRERDEKDPLIVMGGPCSFMNPEPLADFMDLVFVGEAEEMVHEFVEAWMAGGDRTSMLRRLCGIEGFYVPSFYACDYHDDGRIRKWRSVVDDAPLIVRRRIVEDMDATPLVSSLSTPYTEFGDMVLTEVMRGCPFSCRFCAAGHVYDPPRRRDVSGLVRDIRRRTGDGLRVGLIAPSLTEYRELKRVLAMKDVFFSITSLRASRKAAAIVEMLKKNSRSVSIAPEAGTERLRKLINKRISEEDILSTAESIFSNGINTLKLYFMIGLPTETDRDVDAIIDLVRRIRALSGRSGVALTVSPFVPKPFTPFQWHFMMDMKTLRTRIGRIRKGLAPLGVRVSHDSVRSAFMQGVFAAGDRRVAAVVYNVSRQKDWKRNCREAGIDPAFYVARRKDRGEIFPWDFIDNRISKERLFEEYSEALRT